MFKKTSFVIFVLFFYSNVAFGHGFGGGILHPLTGLDHLFAMATVGILSAQLGKKNLFILPLCFLIFMFLGSEISKFNIEIRHIELMINLSVIFLGIAVTKVVTLKQTTILVAVAIIGYLHGYVQGIEIPKHLNAMMYTLGLQVTTLGLIVMGIAIGLLILEEKKGKKVMKYLGQSISIVGILLLIVSV
jgi:urease accessory protein